MDLKTTRMEELRKTQFPIEERLKIPILPSTYLECKLQSSHDVLEKDIEKNIKDSENKVIQNGMSFPFSLDSSLRFVPVEAVKVLSTGEDVKRVLNLSLNIGDNELNCLPGDTVGIVPQNITDEIEKLLTCLDLLEQADNLYVVDVLSGTKKKNATIPPYLPKVFILRDILKTCVDIRAIPKKAFLRVLSEYTSNEYERRRLEELCSQQGSEEYTRLILNNGICLLDILKTFPSCVPPIARLLEHLPRLQARPYSIAEQDGSRIHIAVTIVQNGIGGRPGLCSGWLNEIASNLIDENELHYKMQKMTLDKHPQSIKIPLYKRCSSSFRVPEDPRVPLIMIGPGTGVAPFIGFLQYRSAQKKAASKIQLGYAWLFFGCRYENRDYIYRAEMNDFLSQRILNKLSVSFSRDIHELDGNDETRVKYVQDNIKKEKEQFVTQLLERNNVTFLCGDAKHMAKDVQQTIIQCIQEVKGINETEAKEVFSNLGKDKRYLQDVWQ